MDIATFAKLAQFLEGEDRVEAQVVVDAFRAIKAMPITSMKEEAAATQAYEAAMSAAYKLFGRLFLEGKLYQLPRDLFK
jgi:hypothetical protein